jgi:diguanylate cyclase (GGDEF)-like protein
MRLMAIIVGVFITIAMPLTYFLLSLKEQEAQAERLSQELAERIVVIVKNNPKLWEYSVVKFTQVFDENESSEISLIRIYNSENQLVDEENYPKTTYFSCSGKSNIVYNNIIFGHVEIWKIANNLIIITGLLFLFFTVLAFGLSYAMFHLPAGVIKKAEVDINTNIEKLNQLSYYDQITHLRNRSFLNEIFPTLSAAANPFSIIFLDLDNFKHINDSYGHNYGDLLLLAISNRLRALVREDDIIIRFGGDEFIIIFPDQFSRRTMDKKAQSLVQAFNEPVHFKDLTIFVTASMGIVTFPQDGNDLTQLVKKADIAMYEAKKNGRNNYCYYSNAISKDSLEKLSLINNMHKALENEEFVLYYQPKFNLVSKEIIGCEILIRWFQPEKGTISPGDFIPMAEETGLIVPIGEWVIREAFRQIKEWVDQFNISPMRFSINISPHQFHQENLVTYIKDELERFRLDPIFIELEITESISMQNTEVVFEKLNAIKSIGLNIAIDDFGTGYSSLGYLKNFPIDTMKIDMQFVQGINIDKGNEAIVASMVSLAHNLGMDVVAEGIETNEQLETLREKNCDFGQGYLFCRPIPADDFIQMIIEKKNGNLAQ